MTVDAMNKYALDVKSGKEKACKHVKQAVDRYLADLKRKDIYFDKAKAEKAMTFFSYLKHYKGAWAGKPFILSPSQTFILGNIFGFCNKDGFRRFRKANIEVPRKYGKTTFAAGVALYMLIADGEQGAEVYTGATTRDQAKICFNDARKMALSSDELRKRCNILTRNVSVLKTASKLEYVSSDDDTLDGLNPHCVVLDELHAHRTSGLHDIFVSAMGARDQPLLLMITTAGFKKEWWYYKSQRKACVQILDGVINDDSTFCIIYSLDEGDDYKDPTNWKKANPGLGVTIKEDYIKQRVNDAEVRPSEMVNVLTKHFNIWTDAEKIWLPSSVWKEGINPKTDEELKGLKAFGGVDLSSIRDITAYTLNFELPNGKRYLKHKFFVPEDTARDRQASTGIPYEQWIYEGYLIGSPGNTIDYNLVKKHILEDFVNFNVQNVGFDRHNASHIMQEINDVLTPQQKFLNGKWVSVPRVYGISPHIRAVSDPTKELERIVMCKEIEHDGNPVMTWMLANTVIKSDPDGNIRPDKDKSEEKIDGVISTVLSLEQLLFWTEKNKGSVYEERGAIELF